PQACENAKLASSAPRDYGQMSNRLERHRNFYPCLPIFSARGHSSDDCDIAPAYTVFAHWLICRGIACGGANSSFYLVVAPRSGGRSQPTQVVLCGIWPGPGS